MKNFPVEKDGKTYWVSRSVAAVAYVFSFDKNGKMCVLANKRGPGLPNNVGKWNCPSGFLDYGETIRQCAAREVFEETGVHINEDDLKLYAVDDNPNRSNQVVLFRYYAKADHSAKLTNENCEPNEVEEVRWIPLDEIGDYDWTSDIHVRALFSCANAVITGGKVTEF